MPQTSPAGGLSLIIHIIINLIVFIYKKIVKLLNLPDDNFVANIFDKLSNRDGDTVVRKLSAYFIIVFVFIAMGTNFVFMTLRLFEISQEKVAQIQEIEMSNPFAPAPTELNAITETATTTEVETATTSPFKFKNIEITSTYLPSNESITLVDFMRNVGILDTSFQSRAELALELGVIGDASEYSGSTTQNREIINKLKEELNKSIANHN